MYGRAPKAKGLVCQIGAEEEYFIFDDIALNDLKDNEGQLSTPALESAPYGRGFDDEYDGVFDGLLRPSMLKGSK